MSATRTEHKTRDHRFAYISTGDLTKWAKGTTRFAYPEPKNGPKAPFKPITSLKVLEPCQVARIGKAEVPVMVAALKPKKTVDKPEEGTGAVADMIDESLSIADKINAMFSRMVRHA